MDIRKLQRAIVDGLEDVKAQDIVVFNTEALSPLFERVIIASGTSNRQTKALASSVRETVKARGLRVMATEGEDNGEWIIVDCGAAVAHIMQPAIREYYHLEEIWGGKAVKMKTAPARGLPKAEEPARRAGARKAAPAHEQAAQRPGAVPRRATGKTTGKTSAGKAQGKSAGKATARTTGRASAQTPPTAPARAASRPKASAPTSTRTPARSSPSRAPSAPTQRPVAKRAAAKSGTPSRKTPRR
jgi:ribosome-associated protein